MAPRSGSIDNLSNAIDLLEMAGELHDRIEQDPFGPDADALDAEAEALFDQAVDLVNRAVRG